MVKSTKIAFFFKSLVLVWTFLTSIYGVAQDFGCYEIPSRGSSFLSYSYHKSSSDLIDWKIFEPKKTIKEGEIKEYYLNTKYIPVHLNQVKLIGTVKNGKKEGTWFFYYKEGTSFITGEFKGGIPVGTWVTKYVRNGDTLTTSEIPMQKGKTHGLVRYYRKGSLSETCQYSEGLRNGEQVQYSYTYPDRVTSIRRFKNNIRHGVQIQFNESGDTSSYEEYKEGLNHGLYKHYGNDGQINTIIHFKDGLLDGEYTEFFDNGIVSRRLIFKKDLPFDLIQANDTSGQKLDFGTLNKGTGTIICYYDDGKIRSKFNYRDQLINGEMALYYENGALKEKGLIYADSSTKFSSKKSKLWMPDVNIYCAWMQPFTVGTEYKSFYEDSTVKTVSISRPFQDSNYNAIFYQKYSKNGNLIYQDHVKNGLKVGAEKEFYESGQLKKKGNYLLHRDSLGGLASHKHGDFEYYHENGNIKTRVLYRNNVMTGESMFYDEDGVLVRTRINYPDGSVLNVFQGDTVNYLLNGIKQGKWITLPRTSENDCNIEPKSIRYYKDGNPTGTWKRFWYKGSIMSSYEWIDNDIAIATSYDIDGKVISKGYSTKDLEDIGEWEINDSKKGYLKMKGGMKYRRRTGTWEEYKKNGKLKRLVKYDDYGRETK